ncbi:MAG: CdaR family transcriptional regulator [Christensenellales bacterium]|jgi:carbohydrate diacid regulator
MNRQGVPIELSTMIATKIVETAKETIDYNINIMNAQGIIIASSTPSRIDSFHEIAHTIIMGENDRIETYNTDNLLGTRMGINTALKYQNQKVGVLGITGKPDEIRPFVHVLKLAVESMLAYELEQQSYVLKYTQQQHLESGFIYGAASEANLNKWAGELNLDSAVFRIPLLIRVDRYLEFPQKMALSEVLTSDKLHSAQDFITQWPRKEFTVFKAFDAQAEHVRGYRDIIREYLDGFIRALGRMGIEVRVSAGSFCNALGKYHEAYEHAHWLLDLCAESSATIEFFYDHIRQWIDSFVPATELRDIYRYFVDENDESEFIDRMIAARQALSDHNYNFVKASRQLFIHKNTLFGWVNDVRKRYNIDPVQNRADRVFWQYLCSYCERR